MGRFLTSSLLGSAAFHTKSLQIGGVRVDLQIWDTAGQEKFRSLTPMYYRECAAALIVYDLSKPETLETAEYWIRELREKENPYCILLVGNKSDMVADLTEAAAAGRQLAETEKLAFFAASAKTGEGVSDIFAHLVSKLPIEERTGAGAGGGGGGGGAGGKAATVTVAPAAAGGRAPASDCNC